jgi:hypothetical protein
MCFVVVDVDRLRLTTGTKVLTCYLKLLANYTYAWGMKKSEKAKSQEGYSLGATAAATQAMGKFMEEVHLEAVNINDAPGHTDGPNRCFATSTRKATKLLGRQLHQLKHALHGIYDVQHVKVRSMLTDTNEHFHSRMRAKTPGGMPTLCSFQRSYFRIAMETLKAITSTGFIIYTRPKSFNQTPNRTTLQYTDVKMDLTAMMPEGWGKPLSRLTTGQRALVRRATSAVRGARQSTPRQKTAMFSAGHLPPAVCALKRRTTADDYNFGDSEKPRHAVADVVPMAGYVVGEKAIEGGTFVVVSVAALEGCPLLAQYAAVSPYVFCRLRQTVPVRAILGNSKCDVLVELWRSADVRRQGQNVFVGDVSISIKCGEIISVFDESLYLLQLRQGGDDDEMEMSLEEDTWVQLTSGLDDGGDAEFDIGNEEDATMGEDAEDDAPHPKARQSRRKRRPAAAVDRVVWVE